jgi:hypothetical protein
MGGREGGEYSIFGIFRGLHTLHFALCLLLLWVKGGGEKREERGGWRGRGARERGTESIVLGYS